MCLSRDHQFLYVSDMHNHRIQVFERGGDFKHSFGQKGDGAGELNSPHGLSFGPDGNLYVADYGNDRIAVFSKSNWFFSISSPALWAIVFSARRCIVRS